MNWDGPGAVVEHAILPDYSFGLLLFWSDHTLVFVIRHSGLAVQPLCIPGSRTLETIENNSVLFNECQQKAVERTTILIQ